MTRCRSIMFASRVCGVDELGAAAAEDARMKQGSELVRPAESDT